MSGGRGRLAEPSFILNFLNPDIMKIEFVLSKSRVADQKSMLLETALSRAISRGFTITCRKPLVYVECPSWTDWVSCMFYAFAVVSRKSYREAMVSPYSFIVHYDDRAYYAVVYFDLDKKGVRYEVAEQL